MVLGPDYIRITGCVFHRCPFSRSDRIITRRSHKENIVKIVTCDLTFACIFAIGSLHEVKNCNLLNIKPSSCYSAKWALYSKKMIITKKGTPVNSLYPNSFLMPTWNDLLMLKSTFKIILKVGKCLQPRGDVIFQCDKIRSFMF